MALLPSVPLHILNSELVVHLSSYSKKLGACIFFFLLANCAHSESPKYLSMWANKAFCCITLKPAPDMKTMGGKMQNWLFYQKGQAERRHTHVAILSVNWNSPLWALWAWRPAGWYPNINMSILSNHLNIKRFKYVPLHQYFMKVRTGSQGVKENICPDVS